MKKPQHPCYHCPERLFGCRNTCTPWQEYEKAHAEYLEENDRKRRLAEEIVTYQKKAYAQGVRRKRSK